MDRNKKLTVVVAVLIIITFIGMYVHYLQASKEINGKFSQQKSVQNMQKIQNTNVARKNVLPPPDVLDFNKLNNNQNERQQVTTTRNIIRRIRPCVVTVVSYPNEILAPNGNSYVKTLDPYQNGAKYISSGIIVDSSGIVLTTKDAVPTNKIEIKLFRRKPNVFSAKILKIDNDLDLALLQIDGLSNTFSCPLGDSSTAQVGDIVYALGSPFGFEETVTSGIISSNRKKVSIDGNVFKSLIQIDAIINKGNNGGALVNIDGEVIGVNAAIYSDNATNSTFSGIGFAIPINNTKRFIQGKGFTNGI
ncbi:MAG: trypsin-like peptidase domain-containing protein [Oligoflexia bacterium]|nr:trypsin-like peptidase domain-containing protein [Oligoflexia bacterium]